MLVQAMRIGAPIKFVDEVVFSRSTDLRRDWSQMYGNTEVDVKKARTDYISAIATISSEHGFEHIRIHSSAVGTSKFVAYIKVMRRYW